MRTLVLYSNRNTPGRKDATGAFVPEARAFAKVHGVPKELQIGMPLHGVSAAKRRQKTFEAIYQASRKELLDCIAFFGHGWPRGIQFGFSRKHAHALARSLTECCVSDVKIVLYACLAAENDKRDKDHANVGPGTDGGFADVLRDEIARLGLVLGQVDAHKTAGHTTWNPYVVRFLCDAVEDYREGGQGGAWIVAPGSQFWKPWMKALDNKRGGLRYRFPFLSELEIKAELAQI